MVSWTVWPEGVHRILKRDGYDVTIVQTPRFAGRRRRGDEARDRGWTGPVVLVGHSYARCLITEAGNDEKVTSPRLHRRVRADKDESYQVADQGPRSGRRR